MVESIEYLFREGIVGPVSYLFDPGRRIAWVYLLISGILACICMFLNSHSEIV